MCDLKICQVETAYFSGHFKAKSWEAVMKLNHRPQFFLMLVLVLHVILLPKLERSGSRPLVTMLKYLN